MNNARARRRLPTACAVGLRRALVPAATMILAVVLAAPAARADVIEGAQAIALLNQQRQANGIPPITTIDQAYAAAWCPDEEHGPLGGEMWRNLSGSVDWTATSSPWSAAPLHQTSLYDPRMDTAGDVNVGSEACLGLNGAAIQPAGGVSFYAFVWEGGHTDVPTTETVRGEGPFAPQQLVGIPEGTPTGPQPLLYAEGIGSAPHALSWALTTAGGTPVPDVKFVDNQTVQASGSYSPYFLSQGGVMVPPPLQPATTYDGTVSWQGSGGATATQTFSFTTAARENDLSITAQLRGDTLTIRVASPAPGAVAQITGPRSVAVPLGAQGDAAVGLRPGVWRICATSGGAGTRYLQRTVCTGVTVSVRSHINLSAQADGPPGHRSVLLTAATALRGQRARVAVTLLKTYCVTAYPMPNQPYRLCGQLRPIRQRVHPLTLVGRQRIPLPVGVPAPGVRVRVSVTVAPSLHRGVPYSGAFAQRTYAP